MKNKLIGIVLHTEIFKCMISIKQKRNNDINFMNYVELMHYTRNKLHKCLVHCSITINKYMIVNLTSIYIYSLHNICIKRNKYIVIILADILLIAIATTPKITFLMLFSKISRHFRDCTYCPCFSKNSFRPSFF